MKATIETALKDILHELGAENVSFTVEHPADITHGDYASNVALVTAKQLGRQPRELAEEFVNKLTDYQVSVAGPGFINFHLPRDFYKKEIQQSVHLGERWGANDVLSGLVYAVEYTDPNPFKEFHVGHLFTNSVGETLSRLIEFSGATTKRLCYQGDVGIHVANAIWGMQQMGITPAQQCTPQELGVAYAKGATAYKEDEIAQVAIKALNKKIYERSDEAVNALYDMGRAVSLAYFESIYRLLGTNFDEYFFESEAGPKGKELVLNYPEVFTESDGARVFTGETHGLHTRVFLNSEGLPTYEAKELALAKMKEERIGTYDHSIVSTSNEITEYFKVLKKAMSLIYPDLEAKTEHIGHGTVRLASGKMSSRTGDVISALDFINEITETAADRIAAATPALTDDRELAQKIALGAIKYATLKGNILQDTVFNKDEALSFEGASGPYLQYTHARICSVCKKAAQAGVTPSAEVVPEKPYEVEKILYRFPEVVVEATVHRAPHKVAQYLTELAGMFNTFYAQEKIADVSDVHAPYKVLVAQSVAQTLKNGLWALGIEAPERM